MPKKSPGQQKDVPSWIGSHPQCLPAAYWQFLAVCINCKQMDGQIDKKMDGQTVKGTYSRMYCSSIFRQMTGIWGDNNLKQLSACRYRVVNKKVNTWHFRYQGDCLEQKFFCIRNYRQSTIFQQILKTFGQCQNCQYSTFEWPYQLYKSM